jgi:hypothetical protein
VRFGVALSTVESHVMTMVYFARLISTGNIKIGYSANVPVRMQYLIRHYGPIEVLSSVPGMFEEEQAHHAAFERLRLHGEWFSPGDALTDYISSLPPSEYAGRVTWACLPHSPLSVDAPTPSLADPPLPSWLAGLGDATARGLPTRPPVRVRAK